MPQRRDAKATASEVPATEAVSRSGGSRPWKPGKLLGPGDATGRHMCVALSGIDENLPSAGAEPEGGETLLRQLVRGPCSWSMLLSSVGFLIPASVHVHKREHFADWLAAFALALVSVTSPLCDAFCVWSAVYEDGDPAGAGAERRYARTALAVGKEPEWVARTMQEHGALPQVLATDRWNNLSRLIDRVVCVLVVGPALVVFALFQRPSIPHFLFFAGGFSVAFAANVLGQRLRMVYPCGIRRKRDGTVVVERLYWWFMRVHETWHFLLIVLFTASAVHRPRM